MRFESKCHFFAAGQRGGYAIKGPPFEVEEGSGGVQAETLVGPVGV